MNIGDGSNAQGTTDLFARMQQAHQTELADPVGSAEDAAAADNVVELAALRSMGGDETVGAELETRLLETAAAALDDGFETVSELREAVIDAIVEERYADQLPAADAERITRTIKVTLSTDPVFRKEIDNMMIQAARRLAQSENH
jgi:hypothetical protein